MISLNPVTGFRLPFTAVVMGLALLALLREPGTAAAALSGEVARAGAVAGVVVDAHGDPVPGALVLVVDADGRAIAESQTSLGAEGGRALGEFHIAGLPAGEYGLRAVVPESDSVARVSRVPVRAWEDTRVRIRVDLGY